MESLERDEFIKSFRYISGQLKRKFVRRPNVMEAVEAYEILGRQQLDSGFFELCAACRFAAARLEQAVNTNLPNCTFRSGEFHSFIDSARLYSNCKEKTMSLQCYELAANCTSNESMAWMTAMEAGDAALSQEDYSSAIGFLGKALQVSCDDKVRCLTGEKLLQAYIRQGLFEEGLRVLEKLKLDQKLRLTQILLALNMKKHINGDAENSKRIKAALENATEPFFPDELEVAVFSLINDEMNEGLCAILWKHLSIDQQQLLLSWLCM